MPSYHFHSFGGQVELDAGGIEPADIGVAEREAARLLGQMIVDDPETGTAGMQLQIADEWGLMVSIFNLSMINVK